MLWGVHYCPLDQGKQSDRPSDRFFLPLISHKPTQVTQAMYHTPTEIKIGGELDPREVCQHPKSYEFIL